MRKIIISSAAIMFLFSSLAGCTASQSKILMNDKDVKEVTNKPIAFEMLNYNELDKDIAAESEFLKFLFGYNYWKASEGYVFVISGGPAGTPGHGIKIKSVEEDKEGKTIINVEQTSPPQGETQIQVVTFPLAIYRVHATNENFVVRNQNGKEFTHYPENEFTVTGTVTEIITLKDWLYPPHYIRVIPDVEGDRMNGSYFVDFVQFSISNSASKQAKELKKGDRVSLVYSIMGMSNFNVKSVTKLDKAADNTVPTVNKTTVTSTQDNVSELNYNDLVVKVGMYSKSILDKLGNGSATEDNNYGFVGWSEDNKYTYYYHDYGSFSLYTKVNVVDGTSVIDKISLNETGGINK